MSAASQPAWVAALFNRRMLICILTGFASGLPLYLLLNLVPAWLTTEGLSLKAIGAFRSQRQISSLIENVRHCGLEE